MKAFALALILCGAGCAAAPSRIEKPITVVATDTLQGSRYMQAIVEAVQIQWERILIASNISPSAEERVIVRFEMDAEGRVTQIEASGSKSDIAKRACVSAVTERAPFGDWPAELKALRSPQPVTLTFRYR